MTVTRFDVVIVGSSIASLVEALYLSRKGKKVAIVERHEELGGVWRLESTLGLENIETTPHVFLPDRKAYEVLSDYLKCKLKPWPIQPRLYVRRNARWFREISMPMGHDFRTYVVMGLTRRWDKRDQPFLKRLRKFTFYCADKLMFLFRTGAMRNSLYPVDGMAGLLRPAIEELEKSDVAVHTGANVKRLETGKDGARLWLEDGTELHARKLCLNQHVEIGAYKIGDEELQPESQACNSCNYNFIVKDCEPATFTHLIGVPDVHLVSDITPFYQSIEDKFPGCRFITARVGDHLYADHDAGRVIETLKSARVINQEAKVVQNDFFYYHRSRLSRPFIKKVTELAQGSIYFLIAGDLGVMDTISERYAPA